MRGMWRDHPFAWTSAMILTVGLTAFGITLIVLPAGATNTPSYYYIKRLADPTGWGIVIMIAGLVSAVSLTRERLLLVAGTAMLFLGAVIALWAALLARAAFTVANNVGVLGAEIYLIISLATWTLSCIPFQRYRRSLRG